MNKKTLFLLVGIIAVLAAYFLLKRDTGNTLQGDERNFEIANTDKIDKIFLSNKFTKEYVLLKKNSDNTWTLNDSFKASIYPIETLFEGLKKIRIKRPVSKHEIGRVKKDLALNATKIEIYENDNLSKVYYVGGNTGDEMGTYCMIENAKEPYVCHIPGFNGYLSARYFTKTEGWRNKQIFGLKDSEIQSVKLEWTEINEQNFEILQAPKEPVFMSMGTTFQNNSEVNLNRVRAYLKLWENLSFEGFPINLSASDIDSIYHSNPFLIITVKDRNGRETRLQIYKKGIQSDTNKQFDKEGNPLQYDVENYYAFINDNSKEVVQIQDYIFGKVMKMKSDFLIKK